jgi:hypothetical protein
MVVVGDLDAGDGRAVPKPILQKTLMDCTVSREAADTLNFRFNVSYLTRMRPAGEKLCASSSANRSGRISKQGDVYIRRLLICPPPLPHLRSIFDPTERTARTAALVGFLGWLRGEGWITLQWPRSSVAVSREHRRAKTDAAVSQHGDRAVVLGAGQPLRIPRARENRNRPLLGRPRGAL